MLNRLPLFFTHYKQQAMTLEQAKKIGAPYELNTANKVIIITSDHGVYLGQKDDNSAMIMSVCKHAVRNKLGYFFIKGDEPKLDEIKAAIDEESNQYFKGKDDGKSEWQQKIDDKAFKELMKSGKNWFEKKNYQKARAEFAQAMKLRPEDVDAKQGHDDAYAKLVDAAKQLDEDARLEQAKRDELIRKLGLPGDATNEMIEEAVAKRDAQNADKKAADLKARAVAVGIDENASEDEIKAAEKAAKKKKK